MTDSFALRTELSVGEPLNDAPPPISNVPSGNLKPAISTNLPEEDDLVDALIPWMPNGKGVIDAGGNTGRNSLVWALLGHRVDMFEQNPTSIELARHYAEINQVADAITFIGSRWVLAGMQWEHRKALRFPRQLEHSMRLAMTKRLSRWTHSRFPMWVFSGSVSSTQS